MGNPSDAAPAATDNHPYPLLIKQLLLTPLAHAPEQEIVYRDQMRYSYPTLRERIGRLASALTRLGVGAGDTVAVMDWDSHRYLECYFAVPMMGAVLHDGERAPVARAGRLHARTTAEAERCCWSTPSSCRCSRTIAAQLDRASSASCCLDRRRRGAAGRPDFAGEYEAAARRRVARRSRSPTSTRTRARRCSTPPAPPACPRACTSAIASWCCTPWPRWRAVGRRPSSGRFAPRRRLHADHADVPRPRLGPARTWRRCWASSRSTRGATSPTMLVDADAASEGVDLLALRADASCTWC